MAFATLHMTFEELDGWIGLGEFDDAFLKRLIDTPTVQLVGLFRNVELVGVMAYRHLVSGMLSEVLLVAKQAGSPFTRVAHDLLGCPRLAPCIVLMDDSGVPGLYESLGFRSLSVCCQPDRYIKLR